MNYSCFNLLGAIVDLDFAFSRLVEVSRSLDSSEFDSFYGGLCALRSFADSICDKYSKKN